jgi:hypothetical protein
MGIRLGRSLPLGWFRQAMVNRPVSAHPMGLGGQKAPIIWMYSAKVRFLLHGPGVPRGRVRRRHDSGRPRVGRRPPG